LHKSENSGTIRENAQNIDFLIDGIKNMFLFGLAGMTFVIFL